MIAREANVGWLWVWGLAIADDRARFVVDADPAVTPELLAERSSPALRLAIGTFQAGETTISVRCDTLFGLSCELWAVDVDGASAATAACWFSQREARACVDGDAPVLWADHAEIGRWAVQLPAALVPPHASLSACSALAPPSGFVVVGRVSADPPADACSRARPVASEVTMTEDFDAVRGAILASGARQTYGNRFNHNPTHRFGDVDAYLNPSDAGNIDCDPRRSGFDEIVLFRAAAQPRWVTLRLGPDGALVVQPPEASDATRAWLQAMAAEVRSED